MVTLMYRVGFVVSLFECVVGVIFNSYIVAANVLDLKRGLKLSPCDKILIVLAVNNILLQSDMNICTIIFIAYPSMIQEEKIYMTISILLLFQFYYSFWATSCLCVYYCLSIVSFKLRLFIRMKMRIPFVVTGSLVVSGVGSLLISILSMFHVRIDHVQQADNNTSNMFLSSTSIHISPAFRAVAITIGCCIPFSMAVLSVVLILTSLWTHAWNMKTSSSFSAAQVSAHVRASKVVIYLIFLFAFFLTSEVSLLSSSLAQQNIWQFLSLFFVLIYPTAQSIILILGNSKLRNRGRKMFQCS
ncbi:taste receptor type 2 member 8-like [Pelodytes ibericus]